MKKILVLILVSIIISPLNFIYALSYEELKQGQVKSEVVYTPVLLTSPSNVSLKLFVIAIAFENGKWKYKVNWDRTLRERVGSLYVTLKADKNISVLKQHNAAGQAEEIFYLNPGTRYRLEFYSKQNSQGALLLRKFFNSLPSPIQQNYCTLETRLCPDNKTYVGRSGPSCEFEACPPIAMCDYASPASGCHYENGPQFNPVTQCGKVLVCPAPTPTPIPSVTPTSTQNSLKLLRPNGGETFIPGGKYFITWQTTGSVSDIKLELVKQPEACAYLSDPANGQCTTASGEKTVIAQNLPNSGSFAWTITKTPPIIATGTLSVIVAPSPYKIQISSGNLNDESDENFYINAFPICPSMLCSAPPAGMCYVPSAETAVCGCGDLKICPTDR